MPQGRLTFAVEAPNGLRSRAWTINTGATQSDLYVRCEGAGRWFHVSFHRSGWFHVKVQNEAMLEWTKALELRPGITRLMEIAVPTPVCSLDTPAKSAILVPAGADPDASRFDIFLEIGPPDDQWPGRTAKGTDLVGRLPLANGQTMTVVHHHEPFDASPVTIPIQTTEQMDQLRESVEAGALNLVLWGLTEDQTVFAIDFTPPAEQQKAAIRINPS